MVGAAVDEGRVAVLDDQIRRIELRPQEAGVDGVDAMGGFHRVLAKVGTIQPSKTAWLVHRHAVAAASARAGKLCPQV
jgi:hypothetical protein